MLHVTCKWISFALCIFSMLVIEVFYILGNPGVPFLNSCPIHVTFSMKIDVSYSLQFFDCLLFVQVSEYGEFLCWAPNQLAQEHC